MLYAKIVVGLPVDGAFDYIVPEDLKKKIRVGSRVWVSFGAKKQAVGYVVKLAHNTQVERLKEISGLIDTAPILGKNMLLLTKDIADYYCCSWGEAIETALPQALRKGRNIPDISTCSRKEESGKISDTILIYDPGAKKRWDIYLEEIKAALANNKSVIIILPDSLSILRARQTITANINAPISILSRKEKGELQEWISIRSGGARVVIGTRSCVFAPVDNLGLLIIDEEEDPTYKQEQVPHYHVRYVAFIRAKREKAMLILSSVSPLSETFFLAQKDKIRYKFIPLEQAFPQTDIVDMNSVYRYNKNKDILFSKLLLDAISTVMDSRGKVLLLFNRKGFATAAYCHNCGRTLKCPRCSTNLVYHFQENKLICHYCVFKMELPKICPDCNAGYIKFSGIGSEKVESEICRIFPQAKVERIETHKKAGCNDADIFVATSAIIRQAPRVFDLIGVLGIDNSLNRVDFRASEHAFILLSGLLAFTRKRIIIQTRLPRHHCFQVLAKKDPEKFYIEELKERRQTGFPPWSHLVSIKARGHKEERVKEVAVSLSAKLEDLSKYIKVISLLAAQPPKLRGNYYWQILIRTHNVLKAVVFIKKSLKGFSHSGIIVTVDVDPS